MEALGWQKSVRSVDPIHLGPHYVSLIFCVFAFIGIAFLNGGGEGWMWIPRTPIFERASTRTATLILCAAHVFTAPHLGAVIYRRLGLPGTSAVILVGIIARKYYLDVNASAGHAAHFVMIPFIMQSCAILNSGIHHLAFCNFKTGYVYYTNLGRALVQGILNVVPLRYDMDAISYNVLCMIGLCLPLVLAYWQYAQFYLVSSHPYISQAPDAPADPTATIILRLCLVVVGLSPSQVVFFRYLSSADTPNAIPTILLWKTIATTLGDLSAVYIEYKSITSKRRKKIITGLFTIMCVGYSISTSADHWVPILVVMDYMSRLYWNQIKAIDLQHNIPIAGTMCLARYLCLLPMAVVYFKYKNFYNGMLICAMLFTFVLLRLWLQDPTMTTTVPWVLVQIQAENAETVLLEEYRKNIPAPLIPDTMVDHIDVHERRRWYYTPGGWYDPGHACKRGYDLGIIRELPVAVQACFPSPIAISVPGRSVMHLGGYEGTQKCPRWKNDQVKIQKERPWMEPLAPVDHHV